MKIHNFFRDPLLPVDTPEMKEEIISLQNRIHDYLEKNTTEDTSKTGTECWKIISSHLESLRKLLYDNQHEQCCYCGEKIQDIRNAQLDHINPKEGKYSIYDKKLEQELNTLVSNTNLVCACPGCNNRKSNNIKDFIHPYNTSMADYFEGLYHIEDKENLIPIIISNRTYSIPNGKTAFANNHINTFLLNSSTRVSYRMRLLLCQMYISQQETKPHKNKK